MKLVTGHDQKLNFSKTGHQTHQLVTKPAGHDQTGHKSHKTQEANTNINNKRLGFKFMFLFKVKKNSI
jgi:hypothetical protein